MKIKGLQGEYAFKALVKTEFGWKLTTDTYYFNQKEVREYWKISEVIWPVEVQDGQVVYIPAQEELE